MKHEIINLLEKPSEHGFMPTLTTYLLDAYENDTARPAVIVFPGGAYAMCSPREGERIALHYNSAGFHAFILDYSVAPHRHPAPINDAANAISYVRSNAKKWNIDPEKIAIIGFSAGGHLAASISTLWNDEKIFSKEKIDSQIHKPNACILSYPVITSGEKAHRGSFNNLLGKDASNEEIEYFSLENRVSQNTPPTFLWHTYEDGAVPVENSLLYASSLAKYKVPCELHVYPVGPHGLSRVSDETIWSLPKYRRKYSWMELSVEWLLDTFKVEAEI